VRIWVIVNKHSKITPTSSHLPKSQDAQLSYLQEWCAREKTKEKSDTLFHSISIYWSRWYSDLVVQHWTCDHWVEGLILTGARLRNNLWQVVHTYASVSKQYNLVLVEGW